MVTNNSGNQPALFTKGDLLAGTGGGSRPGVQAVGTDGFILSADSTQTQGLKWIPNPGSGGVITTAYAELNTLTKFDPANYTDTTNLPNSQGAQILSVTITPTSASNNLFVELYTSSIFNVNGLGNNTPYMVIACAQVSSNAIAAHQGITSNDGFILNGYLGKSFQAGTTSPMTIQFRAGGTQVLSTQTYIWVNGQAVSPGNWTTTFLRVTETSP